METTMRTTYLIALCLLAATAGSAFAQEATDTEVMADEVMEEMVESGAGRVMVVRSDPYFSRIC